MMQLDVRQRHYRIAQRTYRRGIAAIEIFNFQNQGNGGGRQRYLSGARLGGREAMQGGQVQGWGGFL